MTNHEANKTIIDGKGSLVSALRLKTTMTATSNRNDIQQLTRFFTCGKSRKMEDKRSVGIQSQATFQSLLHHPLMPCVLKMFQDHLGQMMHVHRVETLGVIAVGEILGSRKVTDSQPARTSRNRLEQQRHVCGESTTMERREGERGRERTFRLRAQSRARKPSLQGEQQRGIDRQISFDTRESVLYNFFEEEQQNLQEVQRVPIVHFSLIGAYVNLKGPYYRPHRTCASEIADVSHQGFHSHRQSDRLEKKEYTLLIEKYRGPSYRQLRLAICCCTSTEQHLPMSKRRKNVVSSLPNTQGP